MRNTLMVFFGVIIGAVFMAFTNIIFFEWIASQYEQRIFSFLFILAGVFVVGVAAYFAFSNYIERSVPPSDLGQAARGLMRSLGIPEERATPLLSVIKWLVNGRLLLLLVAFVVSITTVIFGSVSIFIMQNQANTMKLQADKFQISLDRSAARASLADILSGYPGHDRIEKFARFVNDLTGVDPELNEEIVTKVMLVREEHDIRIIELLETATEEPFVTNKVFRESCTNVPEDDRRSMNRFLSAFVLSQYLKSDYFRDNSSYGRFICPYFRNPNTLQRFVPKEKIRRKICIYDFYDVDAGAKMNWRREVAVSSGDNENPRVVGASARDETSGVVFANLWPVQRGTPVQCAQ